MTPKPDEGVTLPPLEPFPNLHNPEVCECDLVGMEGYCTIKPTLAELREQFGALPQRKDRLLHTLQQLETIGGKYKALLTAIDNSPTGREYLNADKLLDAFVGEQELLREQLETAKGLLRICLIEFATYMTEKESEMEISTKELRERLAWLKEKAKEMRRIGGPDFNPSQLLRGRVEGRIGEIEYLLMKELR